MNEARFENCRRLGGPGRVFVPAGVWQFERAVALPVTTAGELAAALVPEQREEFARRSAEDQAVSEGPAAPAC